MTAVLFLGIALFGGCNDTTTNPTRRTPLNGVTNLKAYSAGTNSVGLEWTATSDTSTLDFLQHEIDVKFGSSSIISIAVPKLATSTTIAGLTEGAIYTFDVIVVASSNSQTYVNSNPTTIQWAPARRSPPVKMFEIASPVDSAGLEFLPNTPHVLSARNTATQQIIDVLLDTSSAGNIILRSGDQNPFLVGQGRHTKFSTEVSNSDGLDFGRDLPPALGTYTQSSVTIPSTFVTSGVVFYAVSADNNYVRILIQRNVSSLVVGSSPNRYIQIQISYQNIPGVPFAKLDGH